MKLLFANRELVGENILNIIRDNGYAKASFSRLINVPRPTIDKLIEGEIDSPDIFKTHIQKILESLDMDKEQFISYVPRYKEQKELIFSLSADISGNYVRDSKTEAMFHVLEAIIHMYELYYNQD